MPLTAISCSSVAAAMASRVINASNSSRLRFSHMTSIPSSSLISALRTCRLLW